MLKVWFSALPIYRQGCACGFMKQANGQMLHLLTSLCLPPYRGRYIVFGSVCVRVRVRVRVRVTLPCPQDISRTLGRNPSRFSGILIWWGLQVWLDFGDLGVIFKVTFLGFSAFQLQLLVRKISQERLVRILSNFQENIFGKVNRAD